MYLCVDSFNFHFITILIVLSFIKIFLRLDSLTVLMWKVLSWAK
jgi:hypothetical protein